MYRSACPVVIPSSIQDMLLQNAKMCTGVYVKSSTRTCTWSTGVPGTFHRADDVYSTTTVRNNHVHAIPGLLALPLAYSSNYGWMQP